MLPGLEITMNSLSRSMWSTRIDPTVMGGSCRCTVLLFMSIRLSCQEVKHTLDDLHLSI
jgi:hypothetical protein